MGVVGDVLMLDFLNRKGKGRPVTCCIVTNYEWMYPIALLALNLGTGWRWVWVVNVSPRLIYLLDRTTFPTGSWKSPRAVLCAFGDKEIYGSSFASSINIFALNDSRRDCFNNFRRVRKYKFPR